MLLSTLPRLRCPAYVHEQEACSGELFLTETKKQKAGDVLTGTLACRECAAAYPILAGVAVLVNDVEQYLQFHCKGISALVPDDQIPATYREGYLAAKAEIETHLTEEDLESQRINALYFMNHFLSAGRAGGMGCAGSAKGETWWRPRKGAYSAEIDRLVRLHWNHGPFAKIAAWTRPLKNQTMIELGCGVGGLARVLSQNVSSYLGVDTSFASIALARHVYLSAPYSLPIRIPQDLYQGPLTGKVKPPKLTQKGGRVDFVVGELERVPVAKGAFDLAVVLNAIDMIEDPTQMPAYQHGLLKENGVAIHGCPYIWHKAVAENLRKALPKKISSSSAAVEYLYEHSGFKIFRREEHLPWLFLKHFRQIEMYSVHLFAARKKPA